MCDDVSVPDGQSPENDTSNEKEDEPLDNVEIEDIAGVPQQDSESELAGSSRASRR